MAQLSRKRRNRLPKSSFVYPAQRKYPIHDKAHARAALRLGKQRRTFGSISTIRRKVYKRYPSLKKQNRRRKGK